MRPGLGRGVLCAPKLKMAGVAVDVETKLLNLRATRLFERNVFGDCIWFAIPKGEFLYEMMRPEFVKKYKIALSSDAFSGFGAHDAQIHNQEVSE